MISKISGGPTNLLFTTKVLGKYHVEYFVCNETGFIQTEDPYWLDEAYSDAITALDLGLVSRNFEKASLTSKVVEKSFPYASKFIDYGGGYGMFTRLMRDRGFDFLHYDTHCQNLFAKGFEIEELLARERYRFDLLSAWEVFEHLADPLASLDEMLNVADAVLFSTELVPNSAIQSPKDWWYFTPETGQHISFYTTAALEYMAEKFSLNLYSDGLSNHMLSKQKAVSDPFREKVHPSVSSRVRNRFIRKSKKLKAHRASLLQEDFQRALRQLNVDIGASDACSN
ncbi:class I SAM-dependent methyltransferase [Stieleria varia]|uniref:Bifunctional 3-demethylubiquinone-9 3-methyltransferase/ 2-octaprenyl-6-hydroxy phenol methylase n=1 Tax=Stieleria varia TaxID=2528005 RepID=A0A5C6AP40_9BACT|nr:class I SAM-dependent methyltransferase [Stieleria varia]TWU01268.1 hypothetical protein Pla52n_46420 [Stieleria varia]